MALNLLQRVMVAMSRRFRHQGALPDIQSPSFDWDWDERRDLYTQWEAMYGNSIYLSQSLGGYREIILNEDLGITDSEKPLHGYYNPVGCIVDAYQNIFRGQFGKEIKVAKNFVTMEEGAEAKPTNPSLFEPLGKIIRWSNLNDQKESFQTWCAMLGTVGIRIEAPATDTQGNPIPADRRKVRVRPVHPREIIDFNEDADGNVTEVLLEYRLLEGGLGEDRNDEPTVTREEITKTSFRRFIDDKVVSDIPNELGICPFVLLRHKDVGAPFGIPAHYGTDHILHLINWLLTRTGISVDRHVFPKWFAAAAGARPENFEIGDATVAYVQMGPGDTAPKLEALVAKLDFNGIHQLLLTYIAHVRQRQPETVLSALEAMSGQSGETIAKLLLPIEERILIARGRYEHAMTRAMQIGLSWGILHQIWDLGSGTGTVNAADSAYQEGLEDFQFNRRSALPETVFDEINRAKADNAQQLERSNVANQQSGFTSVRQQMRTAGMTEQTIGKIMTERSTEDVTDNNKL